MAEEGTLTLAELARKSGLSRGDVSALVADGVEVDGLVLRLRAKRVAGRLRVRASAWDVLKNVCAGRVGGLTRAGA